MKPLFRRVIVLLCIALLGLVAMPTRAAGAIQVVVDGKTLAPSVPPREVDGRVLIPLRAVGEALGAVVTWNEAARRITVERGDSVAVLTLGSNLALVNGKEIRLDVPPMLDGDSTIVPVRFVSEALGDKVEWNEGTQTVNVTRQATGPDVTTALLAPGDLPFPAFVGLSNQVDKGEQRWFIRGTEQMAEGSPLTMVAMYPMNGVPRYGVERTSCPAGETEWLRPPIGDAARLCYQKTAAGGVSINLTVAWHDRIFMVEVHDLQGDMDFAYGLAQVLANHQLNVLTSLAQGMARPARPDLPSAIAEGLTQRKAAAQAAPAGGDPATPAQAPVVPKELPAAAQARLQRIDPTMTPAEFSFGPIGDLAEARPGQNYTMSLCDPAVGKFNDLCGWPRAVNPKGGRSPYQFYTKGGFPQIGLSLLANGLLTGRPAEEAAGRTYPFQICARDLRGIEICQGAAISVAEAKTPSEPFGFYIGGLLPWARVGQPFRYAFCTSEPSPQATCGNDQLDFKLSGGLPPYTFRAGGAGLPSGLALSADGVISGTPAAGTFRNPITVCATDGAGTEICGQAEIWINQNTQAPLFANTAWKGTFNAQERYYQQRNLEGSFSFKIGKVEADTVHLNVTDLSLTFPEKIPSGGGSIYCDAGMTTCNTLDIGFGNGDLAFQILPYDPVSAKGTISPTAIQGTVLYQGTYAGSFTATRP